MAAAVGLGVGAGRLARSGRTRGRAVAARAGKQVLVAGSTGGTGKQVVETLIREGSWDVKAMARDREKADRVLDAGGKLSVVEADVDDYDSVLRAMRGATHVVSSIGTGGRQWDVTGPFRVDYVGNTHLIKAAKECGVEKFVLVSSIGADDPFFPLNLFWGVLIWKKQAEQALQSSGINYTIVRPGGLADETEARTAANADPIVMDRADAYGLPPRKAPSGVILRSQVAQVCEVALTSKEADNKVVEVVTGEGGGGSSLETIEQLFAAIPTAPAPEAE